MTDPKPTPTPEDHDLDRGDDPQEDRTRRSVPMYRTTDHRAARKEILAERDHYVCQALNAAGRAAIVTARVQRLAPDPSGFIDHQIPKYDDWDPQEISDFHGPGRYRIKLYYGRRAIGDWIGVQLGTGSPVIHASDRSTAPIQAPADPVAPPIPASDPRIAEIAQLFNAQLSATIGAIEARHSAEIAALRAELSRPPSQPTTIGSGLSQVAEQIRQVREIQTAIASVLPDGQIETDWPALLERVVQSLPEIVGTVRALWDSTPGSIGELIPMQSAGDRDK